MALLAFLWCFKFMQIQHSRHSDCAVWTARPTSHKRSESINRMSFLWFHYLCQLLRTWAHKRNLFVEHVTHNMMLVEQLCTQGVFFILKSSFCMFFLKHLENQRQSQQRLYMFSLIKCEKCHTSYSFDK